MLTCLMNCLCENVGSTNDRELRKPSRNSLFCISITKTDTNSIFTIVVNLMELKINGIFVGNRIQIVEFYAIM